MRRRSRSRSPMRVDSTMARRRDHATSGGPKVDSSKQSDMTLMNNINPMMMNNMYPQGNMLLAATGGIFPNMMMPGPMMGPGMMHQPAMDMMSGPVDMDVSGMGPPPPPGGMDMNLMSGIMMDPSLMGMGMFPNMSDVPPPVLDKKDIVLSSCKLIPPPPENVQPARRPRPLGCRTIFVGGLPDNVTEDIVREVFERYGKIHTLRLSKRNFCHIRFDKEHSVDSAIALSGYLFKLTDKDSNSETESCDSNANCRWIHVDFALSRDDQNEYERRQRRAARFQQAQLEHLNMQQDLSGSRSTSSSLRLSHSPSPERVQPFTNSLVSQLTDKLKSEDQFATILPTLLAWLERGECSKKNSNQFYSMIQATNSHIRRLFNEKMLAEDELQECKDKIKINIEKIIDQLEQVAKVFNAAMHKRVWDHFTKPQRKNIETWQKMAQEFNNLREEFNEKFNDDNDYGVYMKTSDNEDWSTLKRENDSLLFQLEAYKNEVDVIKSDAQAELEKFKAQYIARQALQNTMEKPPLPAMNKLSPPPPIPDELIESKSSLKPFKVEIGDARLIGIMSAFLQVHPQGASLDYVVSYVRALFPHVSQSAVHHVLQRYGDVFACSTTGVGANIEHRWSFIAYNNASM